MKFTQWRINEDMKFLNGTHFAEIARGSNPQYFTRRRKMGLNDVALSFISRKGLTLKMDLRNYCKLKNSNQSISKVGYLKQRLKLNPMAFMALNDYHITNFYKMEKDLKRFKDHLICAIDGSKVSIPSTQENLEIYGGQKNHTKTAQAMLGLSTMYDVQNGMILDATISRYDFNEREQAKMHLNKVNSFIQNQPLITLFDRGYPSSKLILYMLENKQKFVMRLSSKDFKREQQSMESEDELVEIKFTKDRVNPYRYTEHGKKLKNVGSIILRFVKVTLKSGVDEYLLTNLNKQTFKTDDIYALYGLRWDIETVYDTLKNKLMLENFTGKKAIIIEQDIYSTIYLCNVIHDLMLEAQNEYEQKNQYKYKYEMKINSNLAIGIVKEDLIHIILEENPKKKEEMFIKMIRDISENLIPIRKNRQFERGCKSPRFKYPTTKKRSF